MLHMAAVKKSAEKTEGEQQGKNPLSVVVCLSIVSQQGCLCTQKSAAL